MKFSLADIETLSTEGVSYLTTLSPSTQAIILAALDFIGNHRNWYGSGVLGALTDVDKDRIDELVALISDEVSQ